jgi:hypothetical protein
MAKVSATSSKGGIAEAVVVKSANVAQSSTAMPPTSVAPKREEVMDSRKSVAATAPR